MAHYFYKCFDCGKEYSAEYIEKELLYLCEVCGTCEKNQPLRGVLLIEYDYHSLKKKFDSSFFTNLNFGDFSKYPELWPLKPDTLQISFPKLFTSFERFETGAIENEIFVMDETRNPTLSYKDRASIVVALKAIELGIKEISAASTGNAGSSLAGIAARLKLKSHIFVPKNIPEVKRIQIEAYGASLHIVDGDYDLAFDACLEFSNLNKIYNRNTAYNPLTIEGKKSAAFDIFIKFQNDFPDIILVPVGDGVIISGIFKGFSDLYRLGIIDKLPKLIAVQAEGSDAVCRYHTTGKFNFEKPVTIADSISAGAPRNLYMANHSIIQSKGGCISVSDDQIIDAQRKAAQLGFLIEPSSAAVLAGFYSLAWKNYFDKNEKILLLFTGSGLKDINSLSNLIQDVNG